MDKVLFVCFAVAWVCVGASPDEANEELCSCIRFPITESKVFTRKYIEERSDHHHHHHKAHSFMHFHGPVHGHHHKVTWKDKHGHKYHDYVAHPKYKFAYGVKDHHTHDHHGQKEHRDGKQLHGEYHIHEPGGNLRTVKYYSDPHGGFFAHVHNHGGNDHSGYGR